MEHVFFSTVIFSTCFFFLSIGILINGKAPSGSCGRRKGEPPLIVDGREVELDCICETTGQLNACEGGISEDQLIEAMQRAKNAQTDIPDLEDVTELSSRNLG